MSNVQDLHHILVIEDQRSKRIVSLKENTHAIGRDPNSGITIYDRQVSRHHATLLRVKDYQNHQDFYRVIDGNLQGKRSTNGIMVNGKYCLSHELKPGDLIRFGSKAKASYHLISNSADLDFLKTTVQVENFSELLNILPKENETELYSQDTKQTVIFKQAEDPNILPTNPSSVVEYSPHAIVELNLEGEITYLNAAAAIKFPELRENSVNHPVIQGILGISLTQEETSFVREIQVGEQVFEQHIYSVFDNINAASAVDSKLIRIYIYDITKYKKLELKLNNSTDYYHFLVEQTSEGIFLINAQTKQIIETNSAYQKLLGYDAKTISQLNLYQIIALEKEIIDSELEQIVLDKSYYVEESLHRCQDGSLISVEERISRTNLKGQEIFCFAVRDISERKRSEERLQYQAFHDPLTNLPNRLLLNKQLSIALANAQRNQALLAVMFLDLDSFKNVNNTLGHSIGDQLLQSFARRLTACVRGGDTVARWGSDEFTVLLPRIKNTEDTVKLAQRIFDTLKQPFAIEQYQLQIKISIGIAIYPQDGEDKESLLKNADAALARTKEQGRNHYQFYTPTMSAEAALLLKLESCLHKALDRQEFSLCYQPQVHMKSGEITAMEVLLRWNHPEFGSIAPSRFIPLAEKTDLMLNIGKWVLTQACEQNLVWQKEGLPPVPICVNLSLPEFQQPNLVEVVARILEKTGLDPQWLELEITEKTLRQNLRNAPQIFQDFQNLGVRLALDDFGTGYSALGYLKQFTFRTLKIDQTFIRDLRGNAQEQAIIAATISLSRGFSLRVVAEGVETQKQAEILQNLACEEAQGYWFSRPLSIEMATQFLNKQLPVTRG